MNQSNEIENSKPDSDDSIASAWEHLSKATIGIQNAKALLYQRTLNSHDDLDRFWRRLDEIQVDIEQANDIISNRNLRETGE